MKIYCELCSKTQPVRIDNCRDAKTNEPYQDIVCAECDFVIASGTDITQPEQEPVAWVDITDEGKWSVRFAVPALSLPDGTKFYTAPPKREWVGLTRRELDIATLGLEDLSDCYKAIEAKLKEKNV